MGKGQGTVPLRWAVGLLFLLLVGQGVAMRLVTEHFTERLDRQDTITADQEVRLARVEASLGMYTSTGTGPYRMHVTRD